MSQQPLLESGSPVLRELRFAVLDLETTGGSPRARWGKDGRFLQPSEITDNGQFLYEYQCDKYIDETIEVAPMEPQKVVAKYAKGLTRGMAVIMSGNVVGAAYAPKSATPAFVTGVAVK